MKKTLLRGVIVSIALAVTGVTARAQSTTPPANGDIRSDRRDIRQDTRDVRSDRRDLRSDVQDRNADIRDGATPAAVFR